MNQTRLQSFFEACVHVVIGFTLNLLFAPLIYPLFGMQTNVRNYVGVSVAFTVVSVARTYVIRRFFNAGPRRIAARLVQLFAR